MKLAYIAGPYRSPTLHGVLENIRAAEKVALKYWREGYAVICPHMNTAFMDGECPDSTWLIGDLEILRRCDVIVMMANWQSSKGATGEYEFAKNQGIPIIFESLEA